MRININKIIALAMLFSVNSVFAMEQETPSQKDTEENMVTTSLKLCRTGRDASDVARLLLSSAEHVSKDMSDRSPELTINSDPIVVSGFCEAKIVSNKGPDRTAIGQNHTNVHNKVDFTEILPQEIIQEILSFCLDDIKYPKIKNAKI